MKFDPPQHTPERLLEMIAGVVEDVSEPEAMPRKPSGYMSPRELAQSPESEDALATMRWQLHATDVLFRNRRDLQMLLWACRVLRDSFGGTPEFSRYGTPLMHRLIAFGWRQDVPATHSEIVNAVRTWEPERRQIGRAA